MFLEDFRFDLPDHLIAQEPVTPRDQARLFVFDRQTEKIAHHRIADLPDFLKEKSLIVANNSKVRKARLHARLGNDRIIEVLVLEQKEGSVYRCMVRGKGIRDDEALFFLTTADENIPLMGKVVGREEGPGMTTSLVRFSAASLQVEATLEKYGSIPLPPYITHSHSTAEQYQTVYAQDVGSAAAPTAGLHFTPELIKLLRAKGFSWEEVTLHVGMGTFLPLREEEIAANKLHYEQTFVSEVAAKAISTAKKTGLPITAVGTTATRTLEGRAREGKVTSGPRSTDLFIYPGYEFQIVTTLLTNFHLPKSSLLLLLAAFLGNDCHGKVVRNTEEMVVLWRQLYMEAIKEEYRFYSFGDAMLIL